MTVVYCPIQHILEPFAKMAIEATINCSIFFCTLEGDDVTQKSSIHFHMQNSTT